MVRYFYDTEFLQTPTGYDLISIGVVAEDGRTYEATSADADWDGISENPWLSDNVVPHLPDQDQWKPRVLIAHELFYFLTADQKAPELWGWFASWDHTCLVKLYGGIPTPEWLPDFTHDVRAIIDYTDLPEEVYSELPIWGPNHSAIADAWKTRDTYMILTEHAPFLEPLSLIPRT